MAILHPGSFNLLLNAFIVAISFPQVLEVADSCNFQVTTITTYAHIGWNHDVPFEDQGLRFGDEGNPNQSVAT